jgi:probable F420-dependent oxidoreductase
MSHMRPFRFLATPVAENPDLRTLTAEARRAEELGCAGFVIPDHLIGQYAPIPVLTAVAAATERIRVGSFVFNINLRHPAVLAQDLATLDLLSDGRLDIGLGAGWNKPEHDAIGIPFEPAGVRIAKLEEAIQVMKGCFADGAFSYHGEHYTVTDHDGPPKPLQRPHPPFFLGGGGKRFLTLAAREAQIIGLAPRIITGPDGTPTGDPRTITHAATVEKLGWIREAASDRFPDLEFNTYPAGAGFATCITDDPLAEARRRAADLKQRSGHEISAQDVLDSPHHYIGTIQSLTEKFLRLREELGISSFLVDDLDALAPLIEDLAGR